MGNSITRNDRQHCIEESQQSGEDTSQSELTKASRKVSVWSLGSLSSRLNWSFSGSRSSSVSLPKFNNKSQRKRSSNFSNQYSKTTWPTRYTDAIFLSHFKRFSRNDEFSIKHTIAKGAFGIVFKVVNKKTPEFEYALKVLRKSKIIEENSVQQIKDEVDIQKLCGHHPFIVKQIDSWQNRSNLHILSEYIPQGELFNKITKFSYDLVRIYVAELALAIDFLHNAGVIYRDVKPENILLTNSFHIKITDFGLSKWLKLGERTRTMCGTFQYMAPEIFHGKLYGHSVDWWALGVVACRMLTNKYPNTIVYIGDCEIVSSYYDDSQQENDQFLPHEVEDLPAAGRDLLIRLLDLDPRTRIKSVLGLQKIAMYKDFNINIKFLQEISPLEIIEKSAISLNIAENNETKSNNDDFREF